MSQRFDRHGGRLKSLAFGPFTLLLDERSLLREGSPVPLGSRAFDILTVLASQPGEILGKNELVAQVWPNTFVEDNNLRVHIAALRKALGEVRAGVSYIANVPGRGYCLTAEVTSTEPPASKMRRAPPNLPGRLPAAIGRVIGRGDAVRQLCGLLTNRRLVTIVGPGGIGKTTVAMEAARALAGDCPDGAIFVDFSQIQRSASMASLIAGAIGQALYSGNEMKELGDMLQTRSMLIVLDNCEHLLDGSALLAETLLRAAPGIRLLATSREPLRAEGEWVQRLASLDYPPSSSQLTAAQALIYPAVELFVERASASFGVLVLTDEEAVAVAEICRRLDGVALAIEFAAGRLGSTGLTGLARSLDDRFQVLTRGRRTALPRHKTLRATLDWSYDLLSSDEQHVLRTLGVFTGFDDDSVAAVVPGNPARESVENVLASLVEKSLVSIDVSGARPRYRLLETTRAYANDKLAELGEQDTLLRRHAFYYRTLFERAETEWETRPSSDWLAAYLPELGNARAVLDWAFSAKGDLETGVALTVATVPLFFQLSLVDECITHARHALDRLNHYSGDDRRWRMRLSAVLGWPQMRGNAERESSSAAWLRTLTLAEEIRDVDYQLRALLGLWMHAINGGQPRDALAYADRFLTVALDAGDQFEASIAARLRARSLHLVGDQAEAQVTVERMLSTYVSPQERSPAARYYYDQRITARVTRERVLWVLGFPDQSLRDVAQNVEAARVLGHGLSLSYALADGACPLALLAGDLDAADRYTAMLHELTATGALAVWHTYADAYRGEILWRRGDEAEGLRLMEVALDRLQDTGFVTYLSGFATPLALALSAAGRTNDALAVIDRSLCHCAASGEGWCLPELHRVRGELLFCIGEPVEAQASIVRGFDIARKQGALSWELRAAVSLAQPRAKGALNDDAVAMLDAVLNRFTEGLETADVKIATSLRTLWRSHTSRPAVPIKRAR